MPTRAQESRRLLQTGSQVQHAHTCTRTPTQHEDTRSSRATARLPQHRLALASSSRNKMLARASPQSEAQQLNGGSVADGGRG
eukprot:14443410-Alexandrium_andersonii.AAC.1